MKRLLPVALLAVIALGCAPRGTPGAQPDSRFVLGTACTVTPVSGGDQAALDAVFARLTEIENRMSANKDGTDLDRVNRAAGGAPVPVPPDLYAVVERALAFSDETDGAFDPTIGPVVKLWEIGFDDARVPAQPEIEHALGLLGRKDVVLDPTAKSVGLKRAGMRLDLGAIAKGYAGDEAARVLAERGAKAAVIDLGGNVVAFGSKPDGAPWRIGVQDPFDQRGTSIGLIRATSTTAVVTSGVYERFFEQDGKRYHHILDTKSGYPVENGLVSVTIVAPSSFDADGLSTSAFALGLEKGMALVSKHPGARAIFIDKDRKVYLSPGTASIFELSDTSFTLAE